MNKKWIPYVNDQVGGDAVLQARDAASAAAAAAAKARMPPYLQAAFAAAEAAAIGASAKLPLTQRGQLEEACRAALQVADRCGMTAEEKTAVGAAAAAAAATWATPEERSEIASSFALATAANLGMSAEAQQQAAGGVSGCWQDWTHSGCLCIPRKAQNLQSRFLLVWEMNEDHVVCFLPTVVPVC